jgi:hypothetical protein
MQQLRQPLPTAPQTQQLRLAHLEALVAPLNALGPWWLEPLVVLVLVRGAVQCGGVCAGAYQAGQVADSLIPFAARQGLARARPGRRPTRGSPPAASGASP